MHKVGEYENSKDHWEMIICYHGYPIQEEQAQIHEEVNIQVEDINEVPQRRARFNHWDNGTRWSWQAN